MAADLNLTQSSQITLPSTEGPHSPIDPSESFSTELADDDRISVIPSSLTPPPSSQAPASGAGASHAYNGLSRSSFLSPPVTGLNASVRRTESLPEYAPPSPSQVVEAPPEELRSMLQTCIAEHAKLKMEAAHHKLQYNLLNMQAEEDAKRAAAEHDMISREIDALRLAEQSRQARRELSAATESAHAKYLQLKVWYEELVDENDGLRGRVKAAKKIIQQKEEEIISLTEDKELLLNRLRENREHFHQLCSPGGIFHGALTPKQQNATPVQANSTPRQTPKAANRGDRHFAALLQALNQENNSAPSTPMPNPRAVPRNGAKHHTRNVQSMSSLPTTPANRHRGEHAGLLPSVDLVPQTEPRLGYSQRYLPETPVRGRDRGRKSRESTISVEDNEELARQALVSVAAQAASFASRASRASHRDEVEPEEVFESQASQAASEMLRRDPRESFEVASSAAESRDASPGPVDKMARLQAQIFAGLKKSTKGAEKRKFSHGGVEGGEAARLEMLTSPSKKARVTGTLQDAEQRVGLGIH